MQRVADAFQRKISLSQDHTIALGFLTPADFRAAMGITILLQASSVLKGEITYIAVAINYIL